jgi:SlyX protein
MTPKMSMHDDEESQRLVELQTKIAYQDKTIAELNQVVIDLNKDVAEFGRRLERLERVVRNDLERRDMPNEKPPHY